MASHREDANNSEKRMFTRDIPDKGIPDKGRDFKGRNEQLHMLLSTTYGLNSSHTKRIHVGLQATSEGVFVPLVKLTGNCADGVYFDEKSWQQFQENMGLVSEYLNGESKLKPNSISINNISVNFTSAYGARSILLAYKENEEDTSARTNQRTGEENCPPTKKRKTYAVAIVMQKPTFLGLKNIAKYENRIAAVLPVRRGQRRRAEENIDEEAVPARRARIVAPLPADNIPVIDLSSDDDEEQEEVEEKEAEQEEEVRIVSSPDSAIFTPREREVEEEKEQESESDEVSTIDDVIERILMEGDDEEVEEEEEEEEEGDEEQEVRNAEESQEVLDE
ncbi:high mobility group nucleosome-binding domain-containing protein 5-like, partial [Temnothorax curvispinosus]|uniref:High mobility group nucleosome-binding domain-containing protein 5-like n=1 Tax=Temnothorax curvispinosus TaxID=300111 RepID=A0A6J1PJE6_9HYME